MVSDVGHSRLAVGRVKVGDELCMVLELGGARAWRALPNRRAWVGADSQLTPFIGFSSIRLSFSAQPPIDSCEAGTVMAGLVPAIHVFDLSQPLDNESAGAGPRGWPGQARP